MVWGCTDNHTSPDASPHAGSHSCTHAGAHPGAHHTGTHPGTHAGTHDSSRDNHNNASSDSATHAGAHTSTYTDVRLQRGPLRRRFPVPLQVGLLRRGRAVLQCGSDLDVQRMHRDRGIHNKRAHSRAHRGVYDFTHSRAHFAQLTDAGAISEFRWQWYRRVVLSG